MKKATSKRHFPFQFRLRTLLLGTAVVAVYLASYFALLDPTLKSGFLISRGNVVWKHTNRTPKYRVLDSFASKLFAPIHYVDRQLREPFWCEQREKVGIFQPDSPSNSGPQGRPLIYREPESGDDWH